MVSLGRRWVWNRGKNLSNFNNSLLHTALCNLYGAVFLVWWVKAVMIQVYLHHNNKEKMNYGIFNSAVTILLTFGAGLGIWGVAKPLEGY